MLQAVAVGITTGVYSLVPVLDPATEPKFADWLRVFQIVSPTITISGGAAIVLSSIIFAKRAQDAERRASAAEAQLQSLRAESAQLRAESAERWARDAEAQLQTVKAELARVTERLERLENGDGAVTK